MLTVQCDTVVTAKQRKKTPSGTFCEEKLGVGPSFSVKLAEHEEHESRPDHDASKFQARQ